MTVNATTPVTSPAASTAPSAASAATQGLSYNDFLTLLMAEMKNQDPTQPMDPSHIFSCETGVVRKGQEIPNVLTYLRMS